MSSLEKHDRSGWHANAACTGDMGSVFYRPVRPERKAARVSRERLAKAVCASCPVRPECLHHAMTHDERYGIWGGMTIRERQITSAPFT
jgi:WhiB family redox-sensing transcriptional regulator